MTDQFRLTLEQRVARIEADFERLGAIHEAYVNVLTDKVTKLEAFVDAFDAYDAAIEVEAETGVEVGDDVTFPLIDAMFDTRDAIDWKPRP